jgi:hypothetical protein
MKLNIILAILIISIGIFIGGCSTAQNPSGPTTTTQTISGIQELALNEQDLQQLGMARGGADCSIVEDQTDSYSQMVQYSFCNYTINSLNDTTVIIELRKYTSLEDLNGTYQYESSHLFSIQGLISENDYGDQSRFRVSDEHDYGGEYNKPGVYYYHLWICKDKYLIHITSGTSKEAKGYVADIGRKILSKFG